MSGMNFLEKLLDRAAVEWLPLEVVAKIKHGKDWKGLNAGDIPVYGSGGIMGYVDRYLCNKPTVLIPRKGSITNIFYVETPLWNVDTIYYTEIDTLRIVPKYLYYFIKTIDLMSLDTGSGRPSLTQAILNKIQIPIPCPDNPEKSLAIQAEIVRILDTFTALTAELTAELTDRQKQYNYYRDRLLTFEEDEVEWKTLGEVADIFDSLHQTPRYSEIGLSMIRVTDIKGGLLNLDEALKVSNEVFETFTKKYLPKKLDLVMSRVGSYGNVGIVPLDNAVCMGQNTVVIHPLINRKYLFHILLSKNVQSFIERNVGGGSQKTLSLKSIKAIPIPLVSKEEQERIGSILDKFDTLTTSIREGLPREIALRQKQYEHYRDLLLTFPKSEEIEA